MTEEFNPYQKWLGIPLHQQPPNPYRLLGLELFEADADAIENAADRQMAHLRTFQGGPHGEACQRILNEISTARLLLLDPARKSQFDERMRAHIAQIQPAPPTVSAPNEPAPAAPVIVTEQAASRDAASSPTIDAGEQPTATNRQRSRTASSGASAMNMVKIVAGSVGGLCIAIVILLLLGVDPFGITGSDEAAGPDVTNNDPTNDPADPGDDPGNDPSDPDPQPKPRPTRSPFRVVQDDNPAGAADPFSLTLSNVSTDAQAVWPKKSYDAGEVAQVVAMAANLATQVDELTTTENSLDADARRQRSQQLAAQLAQVAEVTTLADQSLEGLATQRRELADTIQRLAGPVAARNLISAIGHNGFTGQANAGVVALGVLAGAVEQGGVYELQLDSLDGTGQRIPVLDWADPMEHLKVGDTVAVLGVVLDNPAETVHGYTGRHPRVIWTGRLVPLNSADPASSPSETEPQPPETEASEGEARNELQESPAAP